MEFKVTHSVLIPRPETEILIERILESVNKEGSIKILDIGTGSGNIAVALAKNLPNSKVTAIDISDDALTVARENSGLNNINGQINFYKIDFEICPLNNCKTLLILEQRKPLDDAQSHD